MVNSSTKGHAYERYICKTLSLWLSDNLRDDIFWRTDSGARATTRAKKDKATCGQSGDIISTDEIGVKFLQNWSIECKCGYNKWSFLDALDKPVDKNLSVLEKFNEQAIRDAEREYKIPLLIVRRTRRKDVIIFPTSIFHVHFHTDPLFSKRIDYYDRENDIYLTAVLYTDFLKTKPEVLNNDKSITS